MKALILPVMFALGLSACASVTPSAKYLEDMHRTRPVNLAGLSQLGAMSTALKPGKNGSSIQASDQVVQVDQYLSYFKLFKVTPDGEGPLKVTVDSYCACFGTDKRIMVPVVLAISAEGVRIKASSDLYVMHEAGAFTPPRMSLHLEFDRAPVKYLIVAADNSQVDILVTKLRIEGSVNRIPFSSVSDIRNYPLGNFAINIDGAD